ncbi:hypothetical protein PR003_g30760 [Phytophthora rubi]|uniref:Crinkler effector protein N-terminal domain-containing protein n=1 Tax=Phytophthora rubi TaxID=129364 RepID=A0A6A3GY91_9STRA|nr:hypothetical protein PR002_g29825 [Phytophthora rubi]KAE8961815.1 hypothetical protein PR001_g29922 [Phytophthora rubi]KAE9270625.1 hypothetical protein PR003_g30760 [Phytophthora rubi]
MCVSALASSDALSRHFTPTAFGCRNLHVLVRVRELAEDETHQKTEEEEVELRCLIVGDPKGSVFSVEMKKSDRIEDLQLAVKRLKYEHRVEVNVDNLYLYLAWMCYGGWLKYSHQIQMVKQGSKIELESWIRQKLDPGRLIGNFRSIGQDCIHVLVLPPQTFHFAPQQKQRYLLPYQETGRRLKNAFEVVQIVRL